MIDVEFTHIAFDKARKLAAEPAHRGLGLRLAIEGSTCSGYTYWVGFDAWMEGDCVFEFDDLTVYVDKQSATQLQGINHIDYFEAPMQSGFLVTNEAVKQPENCHDSPVKCRDKEAAHVHGHEGHEH